MVWCIIFTTANLIYGIFAIRNPNELICWAIFDATAIYSGGGIYYVWYSET